MNIALKTQEAIYAALIGSSALMAKISGVFDYVPEGQLFPYITIGEIKSSKISAVGITAEELEVVIRVFSNKAGRKETLEIIEQIKIVLDNAALSMSGLANVNTNFVKQEVKQNKDGLSFSGFVEFRLVVQEV